MMHNPLTLRLAGQRPESAIQKTVWLAAAAGLTLGIGILWALQYARRWSDEISITIVALSIVLHVLTPLVAAMVAMFLTTRDIQHGDYELVRLSLLAEERIVSGYFVAALYRLRYLLALMAAASAILLVLMQFMSIFAIPYVASAWGFIRLAAAIGVDAALRNDRAYSTWMPPLLLIAGIFFLLATLVFGVLTFGCGPYAVMILPFALAEAVKENARRRVSG
jgi:hypothetical protein